MSERKPLCQVNPLPSRETKAQTSGKRPMFQDVSNNNTKLVKKQPVFFFFREIMEEQ